MIARSLFVAVCSLLFVITEVRDADADARDKLYRHLTTNPWVQVDGNEETHNSLKTEDQQESRSVVRRILSR